MKMFPKSLAMGVYAIGLASFVGLQTADAKTLTYDQIIAPGDVDASQLSAIVKMELDGTQLTIELTNTSEDGAGSGAGILLTGIGFNMKVAIKITGGSAEVGSGSSSVGFTGTDLSGEWGYDSGGIDSGALQQATGDVNTGISSMESGTTHTFDDPRANSYDSSKLNGPDFGAISKKELDDLGNGVEAVSDTIVITLNLMVNNARHLDGLVDAIDDGHIALTFGSPGNGTSVPDASTSIMLLGLALAGLAGMRRKA